MALGNGAVVQEVEGAESRGVVRPKRTQRSAGPWQLAGEEETCVLSSEIFFPFGLVKDMPWVNISCKWSLMDEGRIKHAQELE